MQTISDDLREPLVELLLAAADDKFILGHRNADWTGLAPILEEDIAFSALAQDDLAHASALYALIAELTGGDADAIAYGRRPEEYRCAQLVEPSDDFDWALALVRQFFCDHFDKLRLTRLAHSRHEPLRSLAARMLREQSLAIGHADQWIVRLARANDESRARIVAAFERLLPLSPGLFEPTAGQERVEAAGLYPPLNRPMFDAWEEMVVNVLDEAGLRFELPRFDPSARSGRRGVHSENFPALLDELAEVYRSDPQARW